MPRELFPNNKTAYELWSVCNKQRQYAIGATGGFPQRLDIPAILALVQVYDATKLDFEKVLIIEDVAHPILQEQAVKAQEESNAGNED